MKIVHCCQCKMEFGLNDEFERVARQTSQLFSCPAGHKQHFPQGESESEKLRRERDRLQQRVAEYQDYWQEASDRAAKAERRVSAAKGQITKLKNRASKGVCPCCNRHFTNLEQHMANKHPAFMNEPDAADLTVN